MARARIPFEPRTLDEQRLEWLPRRNLQVRSQLATFGWQVVEEKASTPWSMPILECYNKVGQFAAQRCVNVNGTVLALVCALSAQGGFFGEAGPPDPVSSGDETGTPHESLVNQYCAERKLFDDTDHLPLSDEERQILNRRREKRNWNASKIWLLYTTQSPCRWCTEAMLDHLSEPGGQDNSDAYYDHIVVAFEGVYTPFRFPVKAIPDVRRIASRYRNEFQPAHPGIEFFKIHREQGACDQERACREAGQSVETVDPHFDPSFSLQRVRPVAEAPSN